MANTLTGLIPTLYEALDIVSRELVGFIPAVSLDAKAEQAAKDQTIRVPIVPAVASSTAISPGLYAPDSGDQTISYVDMSISTSTMVPVRWNGEEQKGLRTGGQYPSIAVQRFAQAMRTLVNEIETALALVAAENSSRAYGSAGTTPFGSSVADAAQMKVILDDNGAPQTDRALVVTSLAGANLRTLVGLNTVYAAGTDRTLRQGTLLPLMGFDIKESAGIASHTKGTAANFDSDGGSAIGDTTLTMDGSNSGTVLHGDIVTFAGDDNKYCVADETQTLSGAAGGNILIGKPGLRKTLATTTEGTIGASYTPNIAFHRSAIQLLARVPAIPEEGDGATDVTTITDPISGLSFQVAMYKQYRQVHYEVGIAYGCKVIKREHVATLIG